MRRSRFTDEQIVAILHEGEAGRKVDEALPRPWDRQVRVLPLEGQIRRPQSGVLRLRGLAAKRIGERRPSWRAGGWCSVECDRTRDHNSRSATVGSIRAARPAGRIVATTPTTTSPTGTPMNVSGS